MKKLVLYIGLLTSLFGALQSWAADIEVKMLNKGDEGKMIFEPSFIKANVGDTIIFLPTDKGHMAASIKGLIPEGAKSFKSKINKKYKYTVNEEGLYGIRCTPHYANGMVALLVVGDNVESTDFLKGKKVPKKSKVRLEAYLAKLGS
jgi:pseudoazurin